MERLIFNSKSCAAFGYRSFESPQQCSRKKVLHSSSIRRDWQVILRLQITRIRHSRQVFHQETGGFHHKKCISRNPRCVDIMNFDITWQKCTCKRRMQRFHSALLPKMLMAALELLLLKRLGGMFGHQCHLPDDLQE